MKSGSLMSAVLGAILKVIATIVVVFLVYKGAVTCYDYGYRIFTEPAVSAGEGRTVTVTVPKGDSAVAIGELFAQKGLTRDAKLFALQYLCSEYREDVKPGTYELSTAMTAEEMMEVMATPAKEETKGQDGVKQ